MGLTIFIIFKCCLGYNSWYTGNEPHKLGEKKYNMQSSKLKCKHQDLTGGVSDWHFHHKLQLGVARPIYHSN